MYMGWKLCRGTVCGELCRELCDGTASGSCAGELGVSCVGSCTYGGTVCSGAVRVDGGACTPVTSHSPGIHTPLPPVLPAQGGFPTTLSPTAPVPAHSSSQVVHCRVYPPHPLHAPVLVLHLAVYPASPNQGRVGLTDRLTHSAQTQCNVSR